jgi:hypothetical protein
MALRFLLEEAPTVRASDCSSMRGTSMGYARDMLTGWLCRDKFGEAIIFRYGKESLCNQRIELSSSGAGNAAALHLAFPEHVHCLNT